ncbi:MAG TPA: hypothetical protein VK171_09605, partial [Fimbriimonas sp.]|nr:hypothetical protein [Fimbriimonas sp.]
VTVCQLPIYVPAAGYLKISTNMTANLDASQLLYCETFLNQSRVSYFTCATDTVGQTFPVSKSTVVPITAGSHSLSLTAFTYVPTTTYAMSVVEPGIIVEYFPSSL